MLFFHCHSSLFGIACRWLPGHELGRHHGFWSAGAGARHWRRPLAHRGRKHHSLAGNGGWLVSWFVGSAACFCRFARGWLVGWLGGRLDGGFGAMMSFCSRFVFFTPRARCFNRLGCSRRLAVSQRRCSSPTSTIATLRLAPSLKQSEYCLSVCGDRSSWLMLAWRGVAWHGVTWRGGAWRGGAWRCVACCAVERSGVVDPLCRVATHARAV